METLWVDTAVATSGGDGTSPLLTGPSRAFKTWRDALLSKSGGTLTQDLLINMKSGGGPDTTPVQNLHWNFETPDPWRVTCRSYPFRHGGVDNGGGLTSYNMLINDAHAIYNGVPSRVTLDGIEVVLICNTTGGGSVNYNAFRLATANNIGPQSHKFRNCYARLIQLGDDKLVGFIDSNSADGGTCERENCIVVGQGGNVYNAFQSDGSAWAITNLKNLNCSCYGVVYGWLDVQICVNCLGAESSGQDFLSTGSSGHENNASSDGSAAGTNSRINKTFSFINKDGGDLGLLETDLGAKGFGKDLSSLFTDDAADRTRVLPWDIGARMFYEQVAGLGNVPWSGISGLSGLSGGGRIRGRR